MRERVVDDQIEVGLHEVVPNGRGRIGVGIGLGVGWNGGFVGGKEFEQVMLLGLGSVGEKVVGKGGEVAGWRCSLGGLVKR